MFKYKNLLIIFIFVVGVLFTHNASATAPLQQTFTYTGAPQTFTVPAGVTTVWISMVGGGGGGGNGNGGGGGSGGSYNDTNGVGSTVSSSVPITVTVGAGGAAGAYRSNGGEGSQTAFGGIIVGYGHGGATGYNNGNNSGGAGGAGGGAAFGTVAGVAGSAGASSYNVSWANGGIGGASIFGAGGASGYGTSSSGHNGSAGINYGSGGGGGVNWFGTMYSGGDGAPGVVNVYYYPIACSSPLTHYNCSAGTSANNVDNGTSWTWDCNSPSGGVSCSELKPTGTLTATNCTIAGNASTCPSSVSWNTTVSTQTIVTSNPFGVISSAAKSGINVSTPIGYGTTTFSFKYSSGGGDIMSDTLANATANATCATGTWNGSVCAVPPPTVLPPTVLPPPPSGTISATSCVINYNEPTCPSTVTWTTANLPTGSTTEVTRNNPPNTHVSWQANNSYGTISIPLGTSTFYLYNSSQVDPLASSNPVTATCPGTWTGTTCVPTYNPTLSLSASPIAPLSINSTGTSTITTTSSGVTNITYGNPPGAFPKVSLGSNLGPTLSPDGKILTVKTTTNPLSTSGTVTVTATGDKPDGGTISALVNVNVIVPPPPINLTSSCSANGTVGTFSWTAPTAISPDTQNYNTFYTRATVGSGGAQLPYPAWDDNFVGTSKTFTTTPGSSYSIWVHSRSTVNGAYGNPVYTWIDCPIPVPTPVPPTISSPTATNITSNSATLGAYITSTGGASSVTHGFCLSTSYPPNSPSSNCQTDSTPVNTGSISKSYSGLASGTSYNYAGYVTNSAGTGYTVINSFTTTTAPAPVITSFYADSTSIAYGASTTLHWASSGAAYCAGGGGWSVSYNAGSQSTGALTSTTTYTLRCSDTQTWTSTQSVTVTVGAAPTPSPINLTSSCSADGTVGTFSWTAPTGYTTFITRATVGSGGAQLPYPAWDDNFVGTSKTFTTTPGTSYSIWVHTKDTTDDTYSNPPVYTWIDCPIPVPPTIPSPINLTSSCSADGTVGTFSWTAPTGYNTFITRATVGSGGAQLPYPAWDNNFVGTSKTFTTTPGTSYSIWVHTKDTTDDTYSNPPVYTWIDCPIPVIPVNGVWSDWGTCSGNCGGTGTQTRTCTPPQNGGVPCSAIDGGNYTQSCNMPACGVISGNISATSCLIANGAFTCPSTVTWTTANLPTGSTTEVTRNNLDNTHVSWLTASPANFTNDINYGTSTFYLYNSSQVDPLASSNLVTASCTSGNWNDTSKKCEAITVSCSPNNPYVCIPTDVISTEQNSVDCTWICGTTECSASVDKCSTLPPGQTPTGTGKQPGYKEN